MRDDYVWDQSGDAEPDLVALERALATLRHRAPMVELPEQSFVATGKAARSGWARPIVLGALLSSTLTVLLIWGFVRLVPLQVEEIVSLEEVVAVTAPSGRSRQAEERARLQRLEVLVRELKATVEQLDAAVAKLTAEQERRPAARDDELMATTRDVQKLLQEDENERVRDELGGAGTLRDKLNSTDIKEGIAPHKANAKRCGVEHGSKPGEKVAIKLSISGATGRVTQSVATGSHKGTPLGECIAKALSHAKFPRFTKEVLGVLYPIRL